VFIHNVSSCRFAYKISKATGQPFALDTGRIFTVEENALMGRLGDAVQRFLEKKGSEGRWGVVGQERFTR
jgi:deoxyxylulose-5-phosphate synthase